MNDEVLKMMNAKRGEVPTLPGDTPTQVNRFTESQGHPYYAAMKGYSGFNNTEGVFLWRDKHLQPTSSGYSSIILGMVNEMLQRDTMNRVAGLCQINGAGNWVIRPAMLTGGVNTHLAFSNNTAVPFPCGGGPDDKALRMNQVWNGNTEVVTVEDVFDRFCPDAPYNEAYTAFPPIGSTVGTKVRAVSSIVDIWEPILPSFEPPVTILKQGDVLQMTVVIQNTQIPDPALVGATIPAVYYQLAPTFNSMPHAPTNLTATDLVYPPLKFMTIGVVHIRKVLKKSMKKRHVLEKSNGQAPRFSDFGSSKVHVRIYVGKSNC